MSDKDISPADALQAIRPLQPTLPTLEQQLAALNVAKHAQEDFDAPSPSRGSADGAVKKTSKVKVFFSVALGLATSIAFIFAGLFPYFYGAYSNFIHRDWGWFIAGIVVIPVGMMRGWYLLSQ